MRQTSATWRANHAMAASAQTIATELLAQSRRVLVSQQAQWRAEFGSRVPAVIRACAR